MRRNSELSNGGDHPTHVVLVLSGFLYRYTIGPEGARQIHSFYHPTEAPCLESLYIDYMDNSLGAVVDSRIGLIPHEAVYRVIDERPEARKLVWRQTLVQAAIFRQWLVRNSNLPAHASLANFFCETVLAGRRRRSGQGRELRPAADPGIRRRGAGADAGAREPHLEGAARDRRGRMAQRPADVKDWTCWRTWATSTRLISI